MSSDQHPEAFSEAARTGLTAGNAATLATCTTVSTALTVYVDLAGGQGGQTMGGVALAGWLLTMCLALYLAGRSAEPQKSRGGVFDAVARGARLARNRPGIAAMVLVMSAGAALTVWSRSRSDQGSVLAALLAGQQRAAAVASGIDARNAAIHQDTQAIRAAVTREELPTAKLARIGFTTSEADQCRAVETGNLQALRLMKEAGVTAAAVSVPLGGGQYGLCLERAFLDPRNNVADSIRAMAVRKDDLKRLYVSQAMGFANEASLKLPVDALRQVGVDISSNVRLSSVRGTALMFAVWSANQAAVEALLAQGADADQAGRFDLSVGVEMTTVAASPLSEAKRLGYQAIAQRLAAAGAHERVSRLPYFE